MNDVLQYIRAVGTKDQGAGDFGRNINKTSSFKKRRIVLVSHTPCSNFKNKKVLFLKKAKKKLRHVSIQDFEKQKF